MPPCSVYEMEAGWSHKCLLFAYQTIRCKNTRKQIRM